MREYHPRNVRYKVSNQYKVVKPALKKSEKKKVIKAVGLSLLLENIIGKKATKGIYNFGKYITKNGYLDIAYDAGSRFDKYHEQTKTGAILAGCLVAILTNKKL